MTIQSAIGVKARKGGKRATRALRSDRRASVSHTLGTRRRFMQGYALFLSPTAQKSGVTPQLAETENARASERERERKSERIRVKTREKRKGEKERDTNARESEADRRAPPRTYARTHTYSRRVIRPAARTDRKPPFYSERRNIRDFARTPKYLLGKSRANCTRRTVAASRR